MAICQRCSATIMWGKRKGYDPRERGAFIALEPGPTPHGLYAMVDERVVPDTDAPADAPRYAPHAVFCEAEGKRRRSALSGEP